MINVMTLILKLSIYHFKMLMFLALHPMESISLNSFVLQKHLAMLLTSTLAINCLLRKGYFHLCPRKDFLQTLHINNSLYTNYENVFIELDS